MYVRYFILYSYFFLISSIPERRLCGGGTVVIETAIFVYGKYVARGIRLHEIYVYLNDHIIYCIDV